MLPVDIVYHSYCVNDFASVLMNKIKKFRMSGLFDVCDNLYILTSKCQDRHLEFFEDLKTLSNKIKVNHLTHTPIGNECDTFNWMRENFEDFEERAIYYCHSKGVSYKDYALRADLIYPTNYAIVNFYHTALGPTYSVGSVKSVYERLIQTEERLTKIGRAHV